MILVHATALPQGPVYGPIALELEIRGQGQAAAKAATYLEAQCGGQLLNFVVSCRCASAWCSMW